MNKKFASLGTALSRDEAKKVMGGQYESCENGEVMIYCTNNVPILDSQCASVGQTPPSYYTYSTHYCVNPTSIPEGCSPAE